TETNSESQVRSDSSRGTNPPTDDPLTQKVNTLEATLRTMQDQVSQLKAKSATASGASGGQTAGSAPKSKLEQKVEALDADVKRMQVQIGQLLEPTPKSSPKRKPLAEIAKDLKFSYTRDQKTSAVRTKSDELQQDLGNIRANLDQVTEDT